MKKLISLLLSMAMVFSMTAVQALAADEETAMLADTGAEDTNAPVAQTVTLDLSQGSITISATGYTQGGRSSGWTMLPSAMLTQYSTMFSSWRTLPGQL